MSTLTSSVSPAASPRPSAYTQFRPPSKPTRSPKTHPSPSPPLFAATSRNPGTSNPAPWPSPKASVKSQYVDAGTQYTPEGLPPTATTTAATQVAGRKRKSSSPPSASPMTTTSNAPPPPPPESQNDPAQTEVAQAKAQEKAVSEQKTPATELFKRSRTDSRGLKVMPKRYENSDPMDLGVLIADMLMELIRLNDKIPLKDGKLTRFHSRAPPGISCHDYLRRLIQHATLSPPILLSMVFYIDKLCAMYPAFTIGSLTVHRFLITAATVASKGLSDSFWTNPTYARIGGISTSELATLELDFLERVDFKIVPQPETLVDYYLSLVQRSQEYRLEDETPESTPESDRMEDDPT